mmetsp:Transcript_24378/g.50603  ORF Transcript_24378/g.50603 Transcript_24378/m.50603 type:complete len:245 (-) Transcript_24378:319-1053(-)
MAFFCMFIKPPILVNVINNNGPVNSDIAANSFFLGSRNFGHNFLSFNDLTIHPVLTNVARAVAAAAPPHPPRNGHTQNAASPITFKIAAQEIIFKGVIASFVTIKSDKLTLCASAAQAIAPLQCIYEVADVCKSGSTFNFFKMLGVKKAYTRDKIAPQKNDTVKGADAASLAASVLPPPDLCSPLTEEAKARETRPVVALLRNENKYNAWSMHRVAGESAASPAGPTVLPTNALSMFESSGFVK